MKIKKYIIGIIAIFISLFLVKNKVNASAPDSFTVDSLGSIETLMYFNYNFDGGVYVHKKKTNTGDFVYCIQIEKSSGDVTYKKSNEALPASFAYVLENGYPKKSIFGNENKDYLTTAIAVWYLSKPYSKETTYNNIFDDFNFANGTYHNESSDIAAKVANLINGAKNYNYVTPTIKLNNSNNNLTLSSDGKYYVSSNISVTTTGNVGNYKVSLNNAPEGTIVTDVNGNAKNTFAKNESFIVKVPASSINKLSYEFGVSISATGTINKAYKYAPDNSTYQAVVALYPETTNLNDTINLKLNITSELKISKQDATTSQELPGATLILKDKDGKAIDTWVSEEKPHLIEGLAPGKYYLTETIAPEGYRLSTETVEITIKEDGTAPDKVIMKNYPDNLIIISKQDATTGQELPGATLILKDKDGKEVEKWISSSEVHIIKNLAPGKYYLTEIQAPEGYELSTETVEFTVKSDGTVDDVVVMKNDRKTEQVPTGDSKIFIMIVLLFFSIGIAFYFYVNKKYISKKDK